MKNLRLLQFGWALALILIGVLFASGFQAPVEKSGVADINRLMEQSDFGKALKDRIEKMKAARQSVLEFIDTNRVLTFEEATRIRDLSLKETPLTKEEQADLDLRKANVIAASKKWTEMATKANMSAEERTLVSEYADRAQKMSDVGMRWLREFANDINSELDKEKVVANQKARAAVQEVGKAQGFTMIYDGVFAPYGANDITDAALQAMNAKK